jgi:hypothetical protein
MGMRMLLAIAGVALAVAGCGEAQSSPPATGTSSPATPLPEVAVVACTANGTKLLTPAVQPQPDGIHVELRQDGGAPATLSLNEGGGWKPGEPIVLTVPPGAVHMGCMTDADWNTDNPTHDGWVTLQVDDPAHLWVDDRTPSTSCSGSAIDYGMNARGRPLGELPDDARKAFHSDDPGDVVELAGYPHQQPVEYRLVHDGTVVGVARYFDDQHGGWLLDGVTECGDG